MKKFDHFASNLAVLERARAEDLENEFIISGVIEKFYVQFELGWKVLKELLKYEGRAESNSGSPREIIKAAYTV
ncbi:MAG: nucleotidyltransferase substrate binding protein, partial [Oscillibacter sp.]|nr:nucleotidyltransferase substrate binding protein [Oscillibacter sp.]